MPTYIFKNKQTEEQFELFMSISEMEQYLQDNPNICQVFTPIAIGDSVKLGVRRTDDNFNSLLKTIKKRYTTHFTPSTVNTR